MAYGQIRQKLERDLHLEARTFIPSDEMLGYCNEAIDEAEAEIHALYEDYMLDFDTVTFQTGVNDYNLPSNIYGNKIRRFLFENGSERYTIHRIRDWKKFEIESEANFNPDTMRLRYFLTNPTAGASALIRIVPTMQNQFVGPFGKLWYIRQANEVTQDSDVVDIPEFANFIMQYMKWRIREKEGNPQYISKTERNLDKQRRLMVETLENMVPDANDEIEPDLTYYEEHN